MTILKSRLAMAHASVLTALTLSACSTAPAPALLSLPLPPAPAVALPVAATPSAASAAKFLTLRRVNIPEYLQTDTVRYRLSDSTLAEWPNTAWAERLEVGLTNHLALLLRQALPSWTVCDAHCPSMPGGQVLIVNIAPMDYLRSSGQLRADVSWRITGPGSSPTPIFSGAGTSSTTVAPDSPVGQAAAMSALLQQVAQDITGHLR
jgi:cholesterol transport system auxiliary component